MRRPRINVPDIMRAGAKTYEQRNAIYGDNYKKFGAMLLALFPAGLTLRTADEWNRFGIFVQIVAKVTRYAESITKGGHIDSAHDAMVYSAMLEELTRLAAAHETGVSPSETPMDFRPYPGAVPAFLRASAARALRPRLDGRKGRTPAVRKAPGGRGR